MTSGAHMLENIVIIIPFGIPNLFISVLSYRTSGFIFTTRSLRTRLGKNISDLNRFSKGQLVTEIEGGGWSGAEHLGPPLRLLFSARTPRGEHVNGRETEGIEESAEKQRPRCYSTLLVVR